MPSPISVEHLATLAAQLSAAERLQLVEKIVHGLATSASAGEMRPRRHWSEIRGIVPYPMCGEDAQEWVSRTRRESDEHREKQWRRAQ